MTAPKRTSTLRIRPVETRPKVANPGPNVMTSANTTTATISDNKSVGTITNDYAAPAFSIDDVTHTEGDSGTTSYLFTVTKTGATALSASVNFATQNGSATTVDGDYQANSGTLTFAANETTKTITVLVNGDTKAEFDETFIVHLSNPANATISDADGTGTIQNDDTDVSVSVSPLTVDEDGSQNLIYTFHRFGSTSSLTVNF